MLFFIKKQKKKVAYARTDRLGEFSVQMAAFFGSRDKVIWYFQKPYFNKYIVKKTLANKRIERWMFGKNSFQILFKIAQKKSKTSIYKFNNRDIANTSKIPPFLRFLSIEKRKGEEFLNSFNLNKKSKYVCLHVRDEKYLSQHESYASEQDQRYRNADILTYLDTIRFLNSKNIFVFRVGHKMKNTIKYKDKNFFDYASSPLRTEFLDCYLGANCYFSIVTGSGWDSIPFLAGRPLLFTNLFPFFYIPSYIKKSITVPKTYFSMKTKRYLSLKNLKENSIGYYFSKKKIDEEKIKVISNSSEDILLACKEMLRDIQLNTKSKNKLQKRFWKKFPTNEIDPFTREKLHQRINGKISNSFLKTHLWLLAD